MTLNDVTKVRNCLDDASITVLTKTVMSIPSVRTAIEKYFVREIEHAVEGLVSKKSEQCSMLRKTDDNSMLSFTWQALFDEFHIRLPFIAQVFCSVLGVRNEQPTISNAISEKMCTRIGLCYAVLLQGRCKECSLVQRILTVCLMENVCHSKVSNMLNCM